ncbi:MAG: hypothetical protein Q8L55_09910 [Phycisphaerales bacterium]|nr:hypothetical protein [Phycisphaerales bacterium]
MPLPNTHASSRQRRLSSVAARSGLPDPRPLTEYTAVYSEPVGPGGSRSRITVTLAQPCIIRDPSWRFVDCGDGTTIKADNATVVGNNTIIFEFEDVIAASIAFVEPPYQDVEVQNFQGGFVRPGGQWFRKAS